KYELHAATEAELVYAERSASDILHFEVLKILRRIRAARRRREGMIHDFRDPQRWRDCKQRHGVRRAPGIVIGISGSLGSRENADIRGDSHSHRSVIAGDTGRDSASRRARVRAVEGVIERGSHWRTHVDGSAVGYNDIRQI